MVLEQEQHLGLVLAAVKLSSPPWEKARGTYGFPFYCKRPYLLQWLVSSGL